MILLADITGFNGATVETLRFSTAAYSAGDIYYEPCIAAEDMPVIRQRLAMPDGRRAGVLTTTVGDVVVNNGDGARDAYADADVWGFDGRAVTLRLVDGAVTTVLWTGTVALVEKRYDSVRFVLRDRDLSGPVQEALFAGDNVLPLGVEGSADLKGQRKPVCYGAPYSVPAPLVNTSKLIYQVADRAIHAVTGARSQGLSYIQGAAYADMAEMYAVQPARGRYRVLKTAGGSYVRLGSQPVTAPVFDVVEGATPADRTAGQIIARILAERGGMAVGAWSADDVVALDAANAAEVGVWVGTEGASIADTLSPVARSVGAWFGFDRAGVFRVRRLTHPGASAATVALRLRPAELPAGDLELLDLSWQRDVRIPTHRVALKYLRQHQPETQFAGSVSQLRKDLYGQEWRTVTADAPAVYDPATGSGLHLLSEALEVETRLVDGDAAQAEANRLLSLWSARQDLLDGSVPLSLEALAALDIGTVAAVHAGRYGYDAGVNVLIAGLEIRLRDASMSLSGFGFGAGETAVPGGGAGSGGVDGTPSFEDFDPATQTYYRSAAPTGDDDADDGYRVGQRWVNSATGAVFELVDATVGAAVWTDLTSADSLAGGSFQGEYSIGAGGALTISGEDRRITVSDGTHDRVEIGATSDGGFGVIIRDAAGVVTLASGGAYQGTVSGTVTGTVTGNLIGTLDGTAASVVKALASAGATFTSSTAGAFAYLSQITAGNIGSYFASAAIGDAYIGTLSASKITTGTLSADRIGAGSITASKLSVTALSAITANLGTVSTGTITSGSGAVQIIGNLLGLGQIGAYAVTDMAGIFRSGSSYGVRGQSDGGGSTGVYGTGYHGVWGQGGPYGVIGNGTSFDFYANGWGANYGPFTGAHEGLVATAEEVFPGDILEDGTLVHAHTISNTLFTVRRTSGPSVPAIGVFVGRRADWAASPPAALSYAYDEVLAGADGETEFPTTTTVRVLVDEALPYLGTHDLAVFNAVGEGMVAVCGEGGDLAKGDLIVTSSTPGKGMRQADDIVRAVTVAKARCAVGFSGPDDVVLVPCIYLCG